MVKAVESQGVKLAYSDGSSPSSFTNIGNITDFQGPGGQAAVIDVSNLDSIMREKLMGLPDEGQFSFNVNLDPDNASHQALRNARANRTRLEFRLTLTDATPATGVFFAYVLSFNLSGGVDQAVKAAITLEIDGAVAWN